MPSQNLSAVYDCLQGKNCADCPTCQADVESWRQLETDFFKDNASFTEDLKLYYRVTAKRKIYEQKKKGEYLTLSEPEALHMLSRY